VGLLPRGEAALRDGIGGCVIIRRSREGIGEMASFDAIRERAERRKGGAQALAALLPHVAPREKLKTLGDDRVLAEMTRRVFCAGFAWKVIDSKWLGFEAAFLGFDPSALAFQPDDFWGALTSDARIVRNGAKILSIRENAGFVREIAREHGSFGAFLFSWPSSNEIGLLDLLVKRGARLGGDTGQMLLRSLGWDGFVLSSDVALCLRDAGVDIAPAPKSKGDMAKIQAQFNAWAEETGLPYIHLSRIMAMSIGDDHSADSLSGMELGET
jgi:3-methyladenine DNA glycosylase Tag